MSILSSDRPNANPKEDLFGHAPFAKGLAESICRYPGGDCLVMALYGPWGSGKSTVLSYISHYLELYPEEERPIVVSFNPWWFSGQENLARAFLGQLQAVLPTKNSKFKKLGNLLGDFSENVGGLIDLSGVTGGAGSKIGKLIGILSRQKPKDVPALKSEICKILEEAGQRILILVDDIDRLTPEETRQLFTVIKALADFPNVTYLLAFDREVASKAIEQQSGLPGERYLEKIIQVPFELPPIDRVALRAALFKRLDEIIIDTPDGLFDQSYWTNIYHEGIDPLIQVPRDVVRFSNTLAVTYPAVRGEVNPVDFIALEAIRVFIPTLYNVLRLNPSRFPGHSDRGGLQNERQDDETFHNSWVSEIPELWRSSTHALMERLFPRVGKMGYGSEWLGGWRKELKACHPDLFPIYFRLSLPEGSISRYEMAEFIGSVIEPEVFKAHLLKAKSEQRVDGLSKAREFLERFMDYVESDIIFERIPAYIEAFLDVGDDLIDPNDKRGMYDFGNISRISRPVYHLLKRLDSEQRFEVLKTAISNGKALACQLYIIGAIDEEVSKKEDAALLGPDDIEGLKKVWIERARSVSEQPDFLDHQELQRILSAWHLWSGELEVREWCSQVIGTNDGLLRLISSFLQHTKSQTFGDFAVRLQPRLNPNWLESYIDIESCAKRLCDMRDNENVPEWALEIVTQFLKEFEMIKAGTDPDSFSAFDD